ncbi:MAG: hypothetical protein WC365_06180 [Candidatus Babeliales bacterium]|jgi:hypothetical protein
MKITKIIASATNNHINFTPEAERFFKAYQPSRGICLSCDKYGILVSPELICFPCWIKQEISILKSNHPLVKI